LSVSTGGELRLILGRTALTGGGNKDSTKEKKSVNHTLLGGREGSTRQDEEALREKNTTIKSWFR